MVGCLEERRDGARAVFSSGTSQLTVAIGGWYADDKGDKADVGREVAGRREDWMRCWEREGMRAFAQEERRDLVEFCMGLGQSRVGAHVTWKESTLHTRPHTQDDE